MADLTDTEIKTALARGRIAHLAAPRATAARYDRQSARIIIELNNGGTFAFPPHLAQGLGTGAGHWGWALGLGTATDDAIATEAIIGAEYLLHWEALDADFRVNGLLAGVFGTKAYMARGAGQATSPAKAAQVNGARGGRPRKQA